MRQRTIEIMVGLFVVLAFLAFAFLALRVSGLMIESGATSYTITASFDNIGGLKIRAPVNIAGVHVGQVTDIALDPVSFQAVVTMSIHGDQRQIPVDSAASVFTEGLLGSNYISVAPGVEDVYLEDQGEMTSTHSALILENLIGQFLFNVKKQ